MSRNHNISDVFAVLHKKNGLMSWFSRGTLSWTHLPVLIFITLALSINVFSLPAVSAQSAPGSFIFSAGGDIGANTRADASLRAIVPSGAAFFLALGDLDYDETSSDAAWCDYVKARVGTSFPFEVLTGNHEEGSASSPGPDGYIGNHAACLPDRFATKPVIPGKPAYPANYYFDYPASQPLMRFILISANLKFDGVQYNFNKTEKTNYNALATRIDEAKQAGLWVMVGLHKDCLTTGDKSCEIGADLMNLLISKKVDLVLQGHDHTYQRSKQIALGTSCTAVVPGTYNAKCIVDDGSDNAYTRGAGTLFLINGVVGRCCYNVKATDSEAGYFIKTVGKDGVDTNGFVKYTVSATRIDARVVNSVGTWGDSFSISGQSSGTTPVPPTATPATAPTQTPISSSGGGTVTVDVAADAYVNSDSPTSNFGSSLALRTDASPIIRSYLRFNVPTLAGTVTRALLRVYANTAVSTGYSVSKTTGSWAETTLNFSNAPAFGAGVGNSGAITANTWTTVDITPLVTGAGQYNFVMTTTNNTATSLVSKEGAAGKHPQLIISVGSGLAVAAQSVPLNQPTPTEVTAPEIAVTPTTVASEIPTLEPTLTLVSATDIPTDTVPATATLEPTVISEIPTDAPVTLPATPTPDGPTLSIEVNPANAVVGSTVSAVLQLSNMTNLYGLQTVCKVDPNVLSGTGHAEGTIFNSTNSFMVDTGFQSEGKWSVAGSLLNPAPAFNGSGTAFSLNYTVLNAGQTTIECTALAVDVDGNLLPISVVNGSFDSSQAPVATDVPTSVPSTSTPELPTAIPLPTSTPTLEPTLLPQPGAISGVVKYEKRPDQTGIAITVSQNGAPFAQGQSNADGSFQLNDVPAGQYVIQFSAQGYLTASATLDVQAGQGATVQVTLLAGDTDSNGAIDLADASFIGANYGIQAPPAPALADLNGDGFINLVDLVLVGKNFGKTTP